MPATVSIMKPNAPNRRGDEWYTPPWIIRELGGKFDTDPCAPRRRHWTAKRCFTLAQNGLSQPWKGTVFCNPPYSNPTPWVERMMDHQGGGVFLVPVRQSFWYQDLALASATAFVLLQTRIAFVDLQAKPIGKGYSADTFCLIVWGGEAMVRVQRALLRGIDMLPGEAQPPRNQRLTGRLYFERQPAEMRSALFMPMSGADDEQPPEDDVAEVARMKADDEAWEQLMARKKAGVNHRVYVAPSTIAASNQARANPKPKAKQKPKVQIQAAGSTP